jgi:hypothetical protein
MAAMGVRGALTLKFLDTNKVRSGRNICAIDRTGAGSDDEVRPHSMCRKSFEHADLHRAKTAAASEDVRSLGCVAMCRVAHDVAVDGTRSSRRAFQ